MSRQLVRLSGADTRTFLQGLITNDVERVDDGPVWAALLNPQGKYLADFFVIADGADLLLDVDTTIAGSLQTRLGMYKLRADVSISEDPGHLHRGLGTVPADGWADPRHDALGWRAWRDTPQETDEVDWNALRVAHLVPETGQELTPDTYILEAHFERLNGVDFRKGCYVGQEVTARMKHKTELRKGLALVSVEGDPAAGSEISSEDGKVVGTLMTRAGDRAIAYLRFDRATGAMLCGDARLHRLDT